MMLCTFESSALTVAASYVSDDCSDYSSISSDDILQALNSAEYVDVSQDSTFELVNSSVETSDDYNIEANDENYVTNITHEQVENVMVNNEQEEPNDPMVYRTQKWLNQEYGSVPGFELIEENGLTGTKTVHALLRALQHELGITELSNNFGPTTSSLYEQNILRRQDGVTDRKFAILQGALWCKGYSPGYKISKQADGTIVFQEVFDADVENAVKQLQRDAGLPVQDGVVSLNLMKALMSMDSFKLLPSSYGSDINVRSFQQWLNKNYEDYTGLSPCDGVYGRNTNKALILALQAEEGLPINVANGNFGKTTQLCCPELPYFENSSAARKYPGTASSDFYSYSNIVNFTKLLQFALYVNGFGDGNFDGVFDNGTKQDICAFQEHHAITVTGKADKSTWLSLFISCGDRNRSAIAADCATILTKPKAESLYANGYRYIGRYLTGTYNGGISKALTRSEAEIILESGLKFFPIYQTSARQETYFTAEQGTFDAKAAIDAAKRIGIPKDTIIYFAVDFDAMNYQITASIIPYFKAVHEEMSLSIYKTGIYGARNVCTRVSDAGYACSSFVGNMSTGFSGNLGFKMPSNWAFDQFTDKDQSGNYLSIPSSDGAFAIDKDGFSGRDHGVSKLNDVNAYEPKPDINAGSTGSETLYGPTVNVMGKEVPLFQANLSVDLKFAQLETVYDIDTGNTNVLIGVNAFGTSSETMGTREKIEKHKEAFVKTKTLISCMGKNQQEFNNILRDFKGSLYDRGVKVGFDFNAYVIGYMTIDSDGRIIDGRVGVLGEMKKSISYPIIPCLYFKLQLEGSLKSGFDLVLQETGQIGVADTSIDLSTRLSLGVEANLIAASAYVGGSGELSSVIQLPFKSFHDSFEAKFTASLFFEWNALAWGARYDWNFVDEKLYPQDESRGILSVSQDSMEFIEPIANLSELSLNSDLPLNTIKGNMQVYTKPQIVYLGNGRMFMAYIDDSLTRFSENRFTLMYCIYDGTAWSAPQVVSDDGTADFEPVLYSDGVGGVHIIWQNANSVFDSSVTLDQMSEQTDLYYSHWNGTTFDNPTAITSNNQNYEMSHRVVSSGNNVSVIWQENSENSSLGVEGKNAIYRRQLINGQWSAIETVASDLSIVNSMDTDYVNDQNVVVFSAKTTNNTSTVNDLELFYFDGTNATRLTNDDTPDYSVSLLGDELYWLSDGTIVSIKNGAIGTKQTISFVGNSVSEIKAISNSDGRKAIVWEQENESEMYFYGITYNSVTSSFGAAFPLTTDKGVVRGWDACLQSNGQIELAFCYADYLDELANGKPYGVLNLIQKSMESLCNVTVNPVATYTGEISANQTITTTVEVCNSGSQSIDQFEVKIFGQNGEILQSSTINQELNVGEVAELEVPFVLPNSIVRTDFKIQVIPIDANDISLSNNEAIFSLGFADLSIEIIEETRGESGREINITVKNIGFSSIPSANIQLHADGYNGTLLGNIPLSNLEPNTERTVSYRLDSRYSDSSTSDEPNLIFLILNILDTENIESNYSNNSYEYYVYPDYSVNVQNGTIGGTVSGGGVFAKDSIVQISASPNQGFVFQGWYEDGVKILDAESTYTFSVNKCRNLEAKFTPIDNCSIVPKTDTTGNVDEGNKYLRGMVSGGLLQNYFMVTNGGTIRQISRNNYGIVNSTGTQVQIISENGIVVDVYTIVILGDVNGDSAIDAFDAFIIDLYINGNRVLLDAYLEAADINQDGLVNEIDYEICVHWAIGDYDYAS